MNLFTAWERRYSIQERFEDFHRLNPQVYQTLVRLTEEWIARGRGKLGIGMLWEVMRWQLRMGPTDDPSADYKLNNVYRSRYVRLLLADHPEWTDLFETRELKAE